MTKDLERYEPEDRLALANDIIVDYAKSNKIADIARRYNLKQADVRTVIKEYRESLKGNREVSERGMELAHSLDLHFGELVRETQGTLKEIDDALDEASVKEKASLLGQRLSAIKLISDIESRRVDVMQKAGLLQDDAIVTQMEEQEEQMQQVLQIVKRVTERYPELAKEIALEIATLTGEAQSELVEGEVV